MSIPNELQKVLDQATELEASPKVLEEKRIEITPRCEYDVEVIKNIANKGGVVIAVNPMYLQELEESKKELDSFCSILNTADISHDVIGINKKVLKYRLVVFPVSKAIESMLKKDAEKFEKIEVLFETGAIRAVDERGELEDNSERGERLKQKEEVSKMLSRWGIEYQVVDLETLEIFPTGFNEKKEIQRQLGKYSLLTFIFKTDRYTKVPMSGTEKREIIKDLAGKFKKYGNGFLEMKNPYTIVAYAKSKKLMETYEKMFSEYWYRYVELDGEIKALKLVVEPLYENGEMFTIEEWKTVMNKVSEGAERLSNVSIDFPAVGYVRVNAPNFEAVKSLYWVRNYHDRKLEAETDKGFVYTSIVFKLEE